jgi:RNA polymerase sigma-70 factor (ECF subfamily)
MQVAMTSTPRAPGPAARPALPRELEGLRAPLLAAVRRAAPPWLHSEVDDLTQVALLRLDRALQQQPDRALTRAYLGRIAYTTVVDELRRRRREREHLAPEARPELAPDSAPGPERLAASADLRADISACLERAQQRVRSALTLYLLGHSVPEIARLLDHTRKTAENTVYRGLAALRRCLAAKGHAP